MDHPEPTRRILVLCTANVCRSVMTAAFLARGLRIYGLPFRVESAGFIREGDPAPDEVTAIMDHYGIDVTSHRSRLVRSDYLAASDLVIGLARVHVRQAVTAVPESWPRCFTLKELVRRGEATDPRTPGERVSDWLARLHHGRTRSALLGDDPGDDVADPVGGPPSDYAEAAALLHDLARRAARLCLGFQSRGEQSGYALRSGA